jgi:hypothetical protein
MVEQIPAVKLFQFEAWPFAHCSFKLSHKSYADQEHQSQSASLRPLFGPRPAMLLAHLHRPQVRRRIETKSLQDIELSGWNLAASKEQQSHMKEVYPNLLQTSLLLCRGLYWTLYLLPSELHNGKLDKMSEVSRPSSSKVMASSPCSEASMLWPS